jgi:hypothetical protein
MCLKARKASSTRSVKNTEEAIVTSTRNASESQKSTIAATVPTVLE